MGTTVMKFSREAGNYTTYVTQEEGDDLGFETTQAPSFPAGMKATSVEFYIAKGLKSGSGNARTCEIAIDFKCNGSWCNVWYGEKYLSGDGGDGTVPSFTISIPSNYQRNFAAYGVTETRIRQDGSYSIKGMSTAHGTATFTYETYYSRCTAPSTVTVGASSTTSSTVSLTWSGADAGVNNAISGYKVEYADSSNNSSWGSWTTLGTYTSSPQNVATPAAGTYRKYRVWTLGAAGSSYNSSTAKESGSVLRTKSYSRCTAPKTVTIAKTQTSEKQNSLSWSGAASGTNNSISGYLIQYADSSDNSNWSAWEDLKTVGNVSTTDVDMPAENKYRKFKVWTLGAAGSSYNSATGTESASTYRGHDPLPAFTDPTLTAKVSVVKALYITELQDRVNTLRGFYGLSAYSFMACTAGVTSMAKWTDLVNEIRAAIDEICTASGKTHETWISFTVNCPRLDVLQQLRDVVLAL